MTKEEIIDRVSSMYSYYIGEFCVGPAEEQETRQERDEVIAAINALADAAATKPE